MENMEKKIRKEIKKLKPIKFKISKADKNSIDLAFGEIPYETPKKILEDITQSLNSVRKYPTNFDELKTKVGEYSNVSLENLFLVNSLDNCFNLLSQMLIDKGDEMISFFPTFPRFCGNVEIFKGVNIKLKLRRNFTLPSFQNIKNFVTKKTKIIYIVNPNNPTGNLLLDEKLLRKLLSLDLIIVVDEAYYEFSNFTFKNLIGEFPNLIILRTFSKGFGLAGLRMGYVISSKNVILHLEKLRENINLFMYPQTSLSGCISAIENISLVKSNIKKSIQSRETLMSELEKLGFKVYPSKTSFFLISTEKFKITAEEFIKRCSEIGLILKNPSVYGVLDKHLIYVGICKKSQISRVVKIIKQVIK